MSEAVRRAYADGRAVVVGIGTDGWAGLPPQSRHALSEAKVIIGTPRQLEYLPAEVSAERMVWGSWEKGSIGAFVRQHVAQRLAVLASGDPMHYGIGRALVEEVGIEGLLILPQPSAVTQACARLGWPVEDVTVVGGLGRDVGALASYLYEGRRLLVVAANRAAPAQVAGVLRARGFGPSPMVIFGDLGSATEWRMDGVAGKWTGQAQGVLHLIAVTCQRSPVASRVGLTVGLSDSLYRRPGHLSADLRAVIGGLLAPEPGELLWQIGGSGAPCAIEWMRAESHSRAIVIEPDPAVVDDVRLDATVLGVGSLTLITGHAPGALTGLERPAAILIAGGLSAHGLIPACWDALAGGGRLVVAATTVESEALLARYRRRMGGALRRLSVERAEPRGANTQWVCDPAVTVWSVTKPPADAPSAPMLSHPDLEPVPLPG